jgi:hypothetical protein
VFSPLFPAITIDVPVPMLTTIASLKPDKYKPPLPIASVSSTVSVGMPYKFSDIKVEQTPVIWIFCISVKFILLSDVNFPNAPYIDDT